MESLANAMEKLIRRVLVQSGKCPECSEENKVSSYEFCHFHLEPCVSEIFDNEVIAWAELPKLYNPKENNNESR